MIARAQILQTLTTSKLLVIAAVVHLIITTSVYAIGRLGIYQGADRSGCVIALSPDSATNLSEANSLADLLVQSGPVSWWEATANLHVKLYSLTLALLRSLLGVNILSVEPINLLSYLAILWLALKLGEELFDRKVGLLAAATIALWPSWLLHTTQLLKDQVFITGLLILVLIMACWLTRNFSWRTGLTTAIAGGAASYMISLTRSGFWGVLMLAIVLIGTSLLVIRQIRERQILFGNVMSAILIAMVTSAIFFRAPEKLADSIVFAPAPVVSPTPAVAAPAVSPVASQPRRLVQTLRSRGEFAAQRLSLMRKGFLYLNMNSGSDIDANVEFATPMDVVRYLPRATEIGFLAPFPNQWFKSGKIVGMTGRLLSGLEMAALYIFEILALIGLWRSRSKLRVWLLFFVCAAGVVPLALAVINLGALYRFRYGFFILVIILGAHGLMNLLAQWQLRKLETKGTPVRLTS